MSLYTDATNQFIDVSQLVGDEFDSQFDDVFDLFWTGVKNIRTLLIEENAIFVIATSKGKDSTNVELIVLEAYRSAIADNQIEAERPLFMTTVDTQGEAIPMKMYVSYAKVRLKQYAALHNINLIYEIVNPPMNDEYFVKYAGSQKLIPNASRSGDCSVILKVDPSERHIKKLLNDIDDKYKIITAIGSRKAEGSRRSGNMAKQKIKDKSIDDLIAELQQDSFSGKHFFKYAPIKDWSTDQVFDVLRLAGSKPLYKHSHSKGIPAYLPDFGILIEIYGNGSNETCEISVGSQNKSNGCSRRNRYGCVYCTMIGSNDKSSLANSELPRWRVLGTENAVRVRDFLFRLSTDIDARAFHARAHDPVVFNRAALQPNTLKPKHLEKMVRYSAQLTLDSIRIANDFKQLVAQGREMEHEGYADIANDPMIPPKTKRSFLVMYKECVQDPKNLNYLFSQEHALLLSFRWAIDGVGSAPFRPLAIWEQLSKGKGWIPYPVLNRDYEAKHGKIKLTGEKPLPEAVLFTTLLHENAQSFTDEPFPLLSLWQRPVDVSDVIETDFNCSLVRHANNKIAIDINYEQSLNVVCDDSGQFPFLVDVYGKIQRHSLQPGAPKIVSAKIGGKQVEQRILELLLDSGINEQLSTHITDAAIQLTEDLSELLFEGDQEEVVEQTEVYLATNFNTSGSLKRHVAHLRNEDLFCGYAENGRKVDAKLNFTKRVAKFKNGKVEKGNTRLNFYPIKPHSRLHEAHHQSKSLLLPDFSYHYRKFVGMHDADLLNNTDALENILVDSKALALWKTMGGVEKALELHDSVLHERISKRRLRGYKANVIRKYSGTHPAELLMAEGVISINKKYLPQLHAIIKRTHIFDEIGLFDFQSMSLEQVCAHPEAITMKQHRADKLEILQLIRRKRNQERLHIKEGFAGKGQIAIHNNLALFEETAIECIDAVFNQHLSGKFHLIFNTSDISVADKANVSGLWLDMMVNKVTHADTILKHILTQVQLSELKSRPQEYVEISKDVLNMLQRIAVKITQVKDTWCPVAKRLNELLDQDFDKQTTLERYDAIRKSIFLPALMRGIPMEELTWNPNDTYLKQYLGELSEKLGRLDEHYSDITQFLHQTIKTSHSQTAKKLTISEKLAILRNRAA